MEGGGEGGLWTVKISPPPQNSRERFRATEVRLLYVLQVIFPDTRITVSGVLRLVKFTHKRYSDSYNFDIDFSYDT